ncbi:cytochrome c oxidase assembly factor 8-like [Branchiostoma lanceolatum]|uniref:cytochrome c oxidase assembly factor 8-like n=1 Tax=Branchiostoma lanceolatum TaxID=7740 RepID=UPI0034572C77
MMIRTFCTGRNAYAAAMKARPAGRRKVKAKASVPGLAAQPPPQSQMVHDWIGPADPSSNLRPIKFRVPPGESAAEERLRQLRAETQKWNQAFWSDHNQQFNKEKADFIRTWLEKEDFNSVRTDGSKRMPPAEDMSEFYRTFLTEHQPSQLQYQREWYKRNLYIIYLSFRVKMSRLVSMALMRR